ncbi:hypothetical protein JCM14722_00140 [Pseudodesulfovibrio portus]|uniref:Uncharacterized protein n=1 Tax=Pseudodesulfovibrio portus TaxID=231439 RepID=A0ABM8AM80_9BACT|nr:hypothetical protein JCM14722_00140 [Pseudodesulfovibrio portus]
MPGQGPHDIKNPLVRHAARLDLITHHAFPKPYRIYHENSSKQSLSPKRKRLPDAEQILFTKSTGGIVGA